VAFGSVVDGRSEVFIWDRGSGTVRRVGTDILGGSSTGSTRPSLSADGRRLAFIVSGTRGGTCEDAYLKDLTTGALSLASVATHAVGGCGRVEDIDLSGDGRHVGFSTTWPLSSADHDFTSDVYLRDIAAGTTTMVSAARPASVAAERRASYGPSLSHDGRWVAFASFADDLGAGFVRGTNSAYLADLRTGKVRLIAQPPGRPLPSGSSFGPVITSEGDHLAFASAAQNLVRGANNHAVDMFVIDPSGARYPASRTPITAPVVPPQTEIAVGPAGTVRAGVQRFVLQADIESVRFQCRTDGGRWHWCGSKVTWKVRPGYHQFSARAVDEAGNIETVPASRVFRAR
jgi:Tol biopolymer transport system component